MIDKEEMQASLGLTDEKMEEIEKSLEPKAPTGGDFNLEEAAERLHCSSEELAQAMEMGYDPNKPMDDGNFKFPKTFIKDGEFIKQKSELKRELLENKKLLNEIKDNFKALEAAAERRGRAEYDKKLRELDIEFEKAVDAAISGQIDVSAAQIKKAYENDKKLLEEEFKTQEKPKTDPNTEVGPSEMAFAQKHADIFFNQNIQDPEAVSALAFTNARRLQLVNEGLSDGERTEILSKELYSRYPKLFNVTPKTQVTKASPVETSSITGKTSKKLSVSDLTKEEKECYFEFVENRGVDADKLLDRILATRGIK